MNATGAVSGEMVVPDELLRRRSPRHCPADRRRGRVRRAGVPIGSDRRGIRKSAGQPATAAGLSAATRQRRPLARRGAAARLQRQLAAPRPTLGQTDRVVGLCDAHRRQLRPARDREYLQQRRAGRSRLRRLPCPQLPGTPALCRSGADRGAGIFARRLAHLDIGRARHHRTDHRRTSSAPRPRSIHLAVRSPAT